MKKFMPMTMEQVESLPQENQDYIMDILKWYDSVTVTYEYGKYQTLTGCGISATYAPDHKFIGIAYADDLYTKEERAEHRREANSPKYNKMWDMMSD